jgi:hypothetical protein
MKGQQRSINQLCLFTLALSPRGRDNAAAVAGDWFCSENRVRYYQLNFAAVNGNLAK